MGLEPKINPTPGDVGRFALHMPASEFAQQLIGWCGDEPTILKVTDWFEAVYFELREYDR